MRLLDSMTSVPFGVLGSSALFRASWFYDYPWFN